MYGARLWANCVRFGQKKGLFFGVVPKNSPASENAVSKEKKVEKKGGDLQQKDIRGMDVLLLFL